MTVSEIPVAVVVNQRGGVGKTTTALALAHYLASRQKRVLLVDLDGQDSISKVLRVQKQPRTVFDVLVEEIRWQDCATSVSEFLDILPADRRLGKIEALLVNRYRKEEILKAALQHLDEKYDGAIIDCSPSLSILHSNALSAATDVLLPVSMDLLAISGANAVLAHLHDFKKYCGYGPSVAGILPTLYDRRQRVDKELLPVIQKAFGGLHVFNPIRVDTKIRQATLRGESVFARPTRGAEDYEAFARKLLGMEHWRGLMSDEPAKSVRAQEMRHAG
jgi:chromosome partitioning protein